MRVASTPYLSNISNGSTPLPFIFDMRCPCLSKIVPVMKTSANAFCPMNFMPVIIMRETHKKMMSRAVTSTEVG